jgi:pyruvate dehydrogenase E1 component alpha subunit
MLRIRLVEERIAALYSEGEMRCPIHLSIGQEATAVGVCSVLTPQDYAMSGHRCHAHYLAKGGDLKAMLAELYGKVTGCTRGRGGSMELVAPEAGLICTSAIVGGTLPIAVGAALSASILGTGQVSAVVFGDGATEEGAFHESLNFAALKRLPVVFVCENNLYACYSHQRARQPLDNIAERASMYGMPGARLDGNDVLAVYEAARVAVDRARAGGGPTLLECRTYRWREHVGPLEDTHLGYRSEEEVRGWIARCPIARLEARLTASGAMNAAALAALRRELGEEIDAAVAFAKSSPFPDPEEMDRWVYQEAGA